MGNIPEIFTVKPYLNPVIKTVTDKLGIKIDLEKDSKDLDHDNALELVHSIDKDNELEKASYAQYAYMDGIFPGSKADGRITQTELMFYFNNVARFNKNSPIYSKYQGIRAEIDRVKKENNIVVPTDDPEGLIKQTLVDNIPIIAYILAKEQTEKTLTELLIAKYPGEEEFIKKAVGLVAQLPIKLYDPKNPNPEYEKVKEKLFEMIKDVFDNKTKGYFIFKLIDSPKMLNMKNEETTKTDQAEIPEQTATDIIKLDQYKTDTVRKGLCRDYTYLIEAFADKFEVNAAPVAFIKYDKDRNLLMHVHVKLYNDNENLNLNTTIIDQTVFDDNNILYQSPYKVFYISNYNLIGSYYSDKSAGLLNSGTYNRENLSQSYGLALDYAEPIPQIYLWYIGAQLRVFDNEAVYSKTFSLNNKINLHDYYLGAIQTKPDALNIIDYALRYKLLSPTELKK